MANSVSAPVAAPQNADPEDTKKDKNTKWTEVFSLSNPDLWIAIAIIVLILVLGWFFGNQIFHLIIDAKEWFREELPYSLIVYYLIFSACAIIFIPYGPFCIAIGFIFGVEWGFVIQMVAILISSAVLFFIGKFLFRDWVYETVSKSEGGSVFKGLMRYIGKDWKEAAKINVLMCFMPVPYGSHPYLFSLTDVPFEQFSLFFMLGMIPNTILNLLIGEALSEASSDVGVNNYHIIGTVIAIVATVVAVWYASTIAQEVLEEAENEPAPTEKDKLIP